MTETPNLNTPAPVPEPAQRSSPSRAAYLVAFSVLALALVTSWIILTGNDREVVEVRPSATQPKTDPVGAACAMHQPGELLTPEEAEVRFDSSHLCLGYVTIVPSTPVRWHNEGKVASLVTVLAADGSTVFEETAEPGKEVTHSFDEGVYTYKVDVLPSFVGTVEVRPEEDA